VLAGASLYGASLGGFLGLADASLRGASLSGTLLLAGALLLGQFERSLDIARRPAPFKKNVLSP
jgi:uncharacterized protein YjbI with pentapeptide repeats